jgi:hypothetical protein
MKKFISCCTTHPFYFISFIRLLPRLLGLLPILFAATKMGGTAPLPHRAEESFVRHNRISLILGRHGDGNRLQWLVVSSDKYRQLPLP